MSRATKVDKSSLPKEGTAFIQPDTDLGALGDPIDLLEWGAPKIVDAQGWDPASPSAPSLVLMVGQSQPFDLELSGELTPSMGETQLETQTQPTVRVRGSVNVEASSPAGSRLRIAVVEVQLNAEGGDPIGIGRASQRILSTSRLMVEIDPKGLVTGASIAVPTGLDSSLHPHLPLVAGMAAGLSRLVVPRPVEPAVGQRWTVVDRFLDAGAVITQRTTFEVSTVEADGKTFEATMSMQIAGAWWDRHPHESYDLAAYASPELPELIEPSEFELEGSGHGRLQLQAREAIPLEGRSGLVRRTRTVVEVDGAMQEAAIEQEMRLVIGRARLPAH